MGFFSDVFSIGRLTTESAKSSFAYYKFGSTVLKLEEESNELELMDVFKSMVEANSILKLREEFDSYLSSNREDYNEGAIYFLSALISYKLAIDNIEWDWKLIRDEVQTILVQMKKNPNEFKNETLEFINYHTTYIKEMYERKP